MEKRVGNFGEIHLKTEGRKVLTEGEREKMIHELKEIQYYVSAVKASRGYRFYVNQVYERANKIIRKLE